MLHHIVGYWECLFLAPRKLAAPCLQQVCSLNWNGLLWRYSSALAILGCCYKALRSGVAV